MTCIISQVFLGALGKAFLLPNVEIKHSATFFSFYIFQVSSQSPSFP
jgi:hypothetical protein